MAVDNSFIHSTNTINNNGRANVNLDECVSYEPITKTVVYPGTGVTKALDTITTYSIMFYFSDRHDTQKAIQWFYATAGARDADLAAINAYIGDHTF